MDVDRGFLDGYASHQRARGLSDATISCYGHTFRAFSRDIEARGLTLLTVNRADIVDWIGSCNLRNRSKAIYTIRLNLLFSWLEEQGHRGDCPTKGLPRAKIPRDVPRPIPRAALFHALELADNRTRLMITLAAYAGMRRAEIAAMDRADILDDRDPALLLIHGKGRKERLVPIGSVVRDAFSRYGLPLSGPVFRNPKGLRLKPHTVGLLVAGHLRACGVDATMHQGRHTFATALYASSGGDIRVVQEMLGHQSPATTAVYAAWSPTRAVNAIEGLPAPPEPEPDEDEAA